MSDLYMLRINIFILTFFFIILVQFCVGTPPNAGSGPSWRRSSVGMVTPPPFAANLIGSPRKHCK